jgi:hypothetical protein
VFELKVRFVEVEKFIVEQVTVLEPSVIVRAFVAFDENSPDVTLKFAVLNVPRATVSVLVPMFNAPPRVTVMPTPFTVTPLNVLPAVVSVPVPVNVTAPVCV